MMGTKLWTMPGKIGQELVGCGYKLLCNKERNVYAFYLHHEQ